MSTPWSHVDSAIISSLYKKYTNFLYTKKRTRNWKVEGEKSDFYFSVAVLNNPLIYSTYCNYSKVSFENRTQFCSSRFKHWFNILKLYTHTHVLQFILQLQLFSVLRNHVNYCRFRWLYYFAFSLLVNSWNDIWTCSPALLGWCAMLKWLSFCVLMFSFQTVTQSMLELNCSV